MVKLSSILNLSYVIIILTLICKILLNLVGMIMKGLVINEEFIVFPFLIFKYKIKNIIICNKLLVKYKEIIYNFSNFKICVFFTLFINI